MLRLYGGVWQMIQVMPIQNEDVILSEIPGRENGAPGFFFRFQEMKRMASGPMLKRRSAMLRLGRKPYLLRKT